MRCYRVSNQTPISELLKGIHVTNAGVDIMDKKSRLNLIYIKDISSPSANILKQDALSLGAELAVHEDVVTCKVEKSDALLIANDKALAQLCKKELAQPFGLRELAKEISQLIDFKEYELKIMGVLNANSDSFFPNSRFDETNALLKIEQMIEDGADIIDIGGVSSRPGSVGVSQKEELSRVEGIIKLIYEHKLYEKAQFSLDSYSPLCLDFALSHGFKIANDITGLADDEVAKVVAKNNAKVCIMHMSKDPASMQENPHYEDVICEVDDFFRNRVKKAKSFGIKDIILDVGIGFGKSLEHNLLLLKHHNHFRHFGYELLVGASRKSMIDKIVQAPVQERLSGSLTLHIEAVRNGANIIRCHDVKEHKQAFEVYRAIKNTGVQKR